MFKFLNSAVFTAQLIATVTPVLGQGQPIIHTQELILEDPDGHTGFGSAAEWVEPYLVVVNRQQKQINLLKRTSHGWIHLDQVEDSTPGFGLFGNRIAVNQDWIFVSNPSHDSNSGLVSIFRRIEERLVRTGQIFSPVQGLAGFGSELSSAGEWLVITSPSQDDSTGAAHAYQLQGQEWVRVQELQSSIPGSSVFGADCAISESGVLVIGQLENLGGTLHVYTLVNGQWTLDQLLEDPNVISPINSVDRFGTAIAISQDGRRIVAGDLHGEAAGVFFAGEAFIYERLGPPGTSTWAEVGNLRASNDFINIGSATARFGQTVAIHGNTVLIGSPNAIGQTDPLDGAIYGYSPDVNGSWPTFENFRLVRSPSTGQGVGRSLEFDGSTVFTGPDVGFSGLSIFELGEGSVRCAGLPGASLDVLGNPMRSDFTVSIHDVAPGARVQLCVALNNNTPIAPSPTTGLCLPAEFLRVGVPVEAGLGGDVYIAGLRLPRILDCQPALCGSSLILQAVITPAPLGPFLTSQAVSLPLN